MAVRPRLRPPRRCSRRTSTSRCGPSSPARRIDRHHGLMLEYAGSQRAGLQRGKADGVAFGLWAVSGVTRFDLPADPNHYLKRQVVYVCAGVVAFCIALFIDPDIYRRYWRPIFVGTVSIIALVFLIGPSTRGSTRWINL